MAKQIISLGSGPDTKTGDTLRSGGQKINDNFDEIYSILDPLLPVLFNNTPVLIVAATTGINQEFTVPADFIARSVLKSRGELYKGTEWTQAGAGMPVKIIVNVISGNTIYIKP